MIDGSTIAAILTGILALIGALASAWMSGWNEQRMQSRANEKTLARYSVPLLIAAWDLANWFYDITEYENYKPSRCAAYGDGWSPKFTSYLLGQYFAGVHIIREMTHFFAHIKGPEAEKLKKLLWKIQDEFVSMNYEGRESLEMRWFEGDILAVQEHMTEEVDHDGDGTAQELRTIGWVEFQKAYAPASEPENENSPELYKLFDWYEVEFQRVIYRRFKWLYRHVHTADNPQDYGKTKEKLEKARIKKKQEIEEVMINNDRERAESRDYGTPKDKFEEEEEKQRRKLEKEKKEELATIKKTIEKLDAEEKEINEEREKYPNVSVIVPDHRVRRLQHLLSDLVELLDTVSTMKLNRPVRRCEMSYDRVSVIKYGEFAFDHQKNPSGLDTGDRVPCDCSSLYCNPTQTDNKERQLPTKEKPSRLTWRKFLKPSSQKIARQDTASTQRKTIVEQSKV
ncbi:hypothetical protein C7974DRAFT_377981 [Boeremia exigua]|uniref:uncharacterized protein n=1 Tax=Boeremia exigua TaxID=749465 RepID=UPI001E8D020A|nr:uncharacterized protein C7974DRAFT_377981 [Boeremia exigua]KAH6622425.1 hypothetical protein C7974DRAFT_377981 [Boeremia exigua]